MRTLYVYEHCPYCVKARMIFGVHALPVRLKFLLNDEEQTLFNLIGKKMVPVLEEQNGRIMGESMEIVHYIDHEEAVSRVIGKNNPAITQWLDSVRDDIRLLTLPHYVLIAFPEFKTQSAIDYYIHKKEQLLGTSLASLREKKQIFIGRLNQALQKLPPLMQSEETINEELSEDDFNLFAMLRGISLFRDIVFPKRLADYMVHFSRVSGVNLLHHYAL